MPQFHVSTGYDLSTPNIHITLDSDCCSGGKGHIAHQAPTSRQSPTPFLAKQRTLLFVLHENGRSFKYCLSREQRMSLKKLCS